MVTPQRDSMWMVVFVIFPLLALLSQMLYLFRGYLR